MTSIHQARVDIVLPLEQVQTKVIQNQHRPDSDRTSGSFDVINSVLC